MGATVETTGGWWSGSGDAVVAVKGVRDVGGSGAGESATSGGELNGFLFALERAGGGGAAMVTVCVDVGVALEVAVGG